MAKAERATTVDLEPEAAFDLWTDISRWPSFIEGFARADRVDDDWPAVGAKLVWQSVPTGRGTVTEKVRDSGRGGRVQTEGREGRLSGAPTVEFAPPGHGGTAVILTLDYKLTQKGVLSRITDLLFIRGAQHNALARTLRRFATEAAEEAAL